VRILNIDASGNVIEHPLWTDKQVLIYNATTRRSKGETPIPVTQLISDGHSQSEISFWLSRTKSIYLDICKTPFPAPDIVVTDYSWAIIHASLFTFAGAKLLIYLDMCKKAKEDGVVSFTLLILCYAHVLRAVSSHLAKLLLKRGSFTAKENLEVKRLALHMFAALLRTTALASAKEIFHLMCIVFDSKYSSTNVTTAHKVRTLFL
jgi:hypothetical protein